MTITDYFKRLNFCTWCCWVARTTLELSCLLKLRPSRSFAFFRKVGGASWIQI